MELYDYKGNPVRHARARVNGIRMHYVIAGEGEPLLLLHGTPKTHTYWAKVMPLLTKNFKVIAPDLRGFGDTDKPAPTNMIGYDSLTNAKDMIELMDQLGIDKFHVHGEDRGAEFAYVLAAAYRDRVKTLSFCEMNLSGFGLEKWVQFNEDNVRAKYEHRGAWQWHISFFWLRDIAEFLIQGKERTFWEWWMRAEMWNPTALEDEFLDEWIERLCEPGGERGCMETYYATLENARINRELAKNKLTLPIQCIGSYEFMNTTVKEEMEQVAESVEKEVIFEDCGHSLALEQPERLAEELTEFMLKHA